MERRVISQMAIAVVVAGFMALGCASTPDEERGADGGEWSGGASDGAGLDGGDALSGTPVSVPELQTIYFDYDKALVRQDQRATLQSNADAARSHPEWRILTVEGHCDERGSEEYNLALGERRAETVKTYLVNLGITPSRVDTVSFGESRAAAFGHDESAWRLNRRAEFRVTR